ncbi:MAG: right-handed parallel beta-helix repeat-containing protein, partial [Planctomycetota bacterium]
MNERRNNHNYIILVVFIAVFLITSVTKGGPFGGGSGTASNPYLIYNRTQLNAIGANSSYWGKHFKLMADIDLSGLGGGYFNIIGHFSGSFDGNGHTISNLRLTNREGALGMFSGMDGGEVKNLGLINPYLDRGHNRNTAGALVGHVSSGTIENCFVKGGTVKATGEYADSIGGLVGYNEGTITDCYANASVSGNGHLGGLVGDNDGGTIKRCYSTGSVKGYVQVGGFMGVCDNGIIEECYSKSNVICYRYGGGFAEWIRSSIVKNCYATGTVKANNYAAGFVAGCDEYGDGPVKILNCYAAGKVNASPDKAGFIGNRNNKTVKRCFWDKERSGTKESDGGTGKTTAQMKMRSTFESVGWDFTTPIWVIPSVSSYPKLWYQHIQVVSPNNYEALVSGHIYTINWQGLTSKDEILIEYSLDGGENWASVFPPNVGNTGSYNWLVPPANSDECLVRVSNASNPSLNDTSNGFFTIFTTGPDDIVVPVDFDTIQEAIDAASEGQTVIVTPKTYTGFGNRDLDFKGKAITVRSVQPNNPMSVEATIINCEGTEFEPHRGFYFHNNEGANSVLNGFTIKGGYAEDGGGIFCEQSDPMIKNCIIRENYASENGGGMFNRESSPVVINCEFEENYGQWGGGLFNYIDSNSTISDCTFNLNSSRWGGGIANQLNSNPIVTNCEFIENSASTHGGGGMVSLDNCCPTVTHCVFRYNSAVWGGGMTNSDSSHSTVSNCVFIENTADDGGGMDNRNNSEPNIFNCTFSDNTAANNGGGMFNRESNPKVTECIFEGNYGQWCGGLFNYINSSPTISDCTFSLNSSRWGGGIANQLNSNPIITNCEFIENSASTHGGGGMVSLENCCPTVTNCVFSNNSAVWGGGMTNSDSSHSTIRNCIFIENIADDGGGMDNRNNSEPNIFNCTFSNNTAINFGGGMSNSFNSIPQLTSCIFWSNTAPSDPQIYDDETSSATIKYSDIEGGWAGEGNIDADPLFRGRYYWHVNEDVISWWDFDEGSGNTAEDWAGDNDGIIHGAKWTDGKIDSALSFDGKNDYVELGTVEATDPLALADSNFTISAWIKPKLTGDSYQ